MKDITYGPCKDFDVKKGHPLASCPDSQGAKGLVTGSCLWYEDELSEHEANHDVHGPCKRIPKEDTDTVEMFKEEPCQTTNK